MIKLLIVLFIVITHNICVAYEFPLIHLKSAGEFSHSAVITEEPDYDRVVNFDNVSTIRKVGDRILLIDNNININCESQLSRAEFLDRYNAYIKPTKTVDEPNDRVIGILLMLGNIFWMVLFVVQYKRSNIKVE